MNSWDNHFYIHTNYKAKDFKISKKGSYVEIIDFNSLPNGLLGITVKCMNKVLIGNLVQLEDGLNIGEIEAVTDPEVDDQALLAEFSEISKLSNV